MMEKTKKKHCMQLRRQIRKTLGTIFLVAALVVTAVPVPEAKAETEKTKYTWDALIGESKTIIPMIPKDCDTIYTTKDGTYQFAYVNESATSPNKVAVILGYNAGILENNCLVIPDVVNAYTRFSENEGARTGYVAVSKSQKPLYYESSSAVVDTTSGEVIQEAVYSPCYAADEEIWGTLPLTSFYVKNDDGGFEQTVDQADQWIKNVNVMYIGNQSLTVNPEVENTDGAIQEWIIAEASGELNNIPENGVFAHQGNIKTLVVGDNLMGIGNYAFYGCTNLESITLGKGMTEIGKFAFANCVNMTNFGIDFASNLQYISDYTFLNCRALKNFTLPCSVTMIYDHAFDGCTSLGNEEKGGYLDIAGVQENKNMILEKIGYYAFNNCSGLTTLVLPDSMSDASAPVHLNNFRGCTNLRTVKVEGASTTFEADTDWTDGYHVEEFYNIGKDEAYMTCVDELGVRCAQDAHSTFYFEGAENSAIHAYTKENAIPFKYAEQDCYELVKSEKNKNDDDVELTYQVNSNNQLVDFNMDGEPEEITIPTAIGPYGVSEINSGSFSGNCFLKKITIPATVSKIDENAFKGCHNLEHVIFEDASAITSIGSGAFATQVTDFHASDCTDKEFAQYVANPKLTFTGNVAGSIPYEYAMNASNYINAGSQSRTYITYYSGWPTNLEIKYVVDEETGEGKATLVDYPTYAELEAGSKYTADNYPYITAEFEDATAKAIALYNNGDLDSAITDDQMSIINAALNLSVPTGVKAYADGLFSGVIGVLNEDGTYSIEPVTGQSVDEKIESITFADIDKFAPYSFSNCKNLETLTVTGGVTAIDDYAFANMPALENVTLSATTESIGLRPFIDCPMVRDINFSESPYFTCENAIIYGLKDGVKDSVVQCLETRGSEEDTGTLSATEFSGINSLYNEAFMDCEEIVQVDLSAANIAELPQSAFANTTNLYSVIVPATCKTISKNAFYDSGIQYVDIPSSVSLIDEKAFNTENYPKSDGNVHTIQFYCEEGSAAMSYADMYENIVAQDEKSDSSETTFTVTFFDWDDSVIMETKVQLGEDAVPPADPVREGYTFTGWRPSFTNITQDSGIWAQYEKIESTVSEYVVRFYDWDDKLLYSQKVAEGEDAILPIEPVREGYKFIGWSPATTNISKDTDVYAQYEKVEGSDTEDSGNTSGAGYLGDNDGVSWNYNADTKTLTITGEDSGVYGNGESPFNDICSEVESIKIQNCKLSGSVDYLFAQLSNLKNIEFDNFDTSSVTSMRAMFGNCGNLTSLDLSKFETGNVINMRWMFCGCKKLKSLDVSNFDTSKVTDMSAMFYQCESLEELNVCNFDTSNVTNMYEFFSGCKSLKSLDVSNFNTSNVLSMSDMFLQCESLEELDVSKFDTGKVKYISSMFENCGSLKSLDVSNFDTSNVTDMSDMFNHCGNLTSLDVSKFNTSKVTDMSKMFYGCKKLASLDVSNWDTNNVTDMEKMFYQCESLKELNVSNFDTGKVTDTSGMFWSCRSLKNLDVSNFNTSQVTDMSSMFCQCESLDELDVSNFDTAKVTDMRGMFWSCGSLKSLDVSNFDTSNVTDMSDMFIQCYNLASLDVSNFDTSNVADVSDMFCRCYNLTSLNVSNFDTSKVTDMSGMFLSCRSLTSLDVSNFDTSNVTDISRMFQECRNLTSLDVSNFDISNVTNMSGVFSYCSNLTSIELPEGIREIGNKAFYSCSSLTSLELPNGLTTIGAEAFGGENSLGVLVPISVTSIGEKAFGEWVTICGYAGSYAETYAVENGNRFCDISSGAAVVLNTYQCFVEKGENSRILATLLPSTTTETITWASSNPDVATVSDGDVTAVSLGTIQITATTTKGKVATCEVSVEDEINGLWYIVRDGKAIITRYEGLEPEVVIPEYIGKYKVEEIGAHAFISNANSVTIPEGVKKIDRDAFFKCAGMIIYGCAGSYAETYAKENEFQFVVINSATNVTLNSKSISLKKGETARLTATMSPSNAADILSWTSSNPTVATVSDGVVTAVAAGSTIITVATTSGKTATCEVIVVEETIQPPVGGPMEIPATNVTLNKTKVNLNKGKTLTLTATMAPSDTTDEITWKSSNKKVASITVKDNKAVVTALKKGTATITATTTSGKSVSCVVTVKETKATKVKLNKAKVTINKGKSVTLKATLTPGNSTDNIKWTTSNKKVAQITANGKKATISGLKKGTATITAKTDSGKKATCKITVKEIKATKIKLNKTKATIKKGKTLTLKATLTPKNSTDTVTWKSSNIKVVKVSDKGKVTALKKGTATITAKTSSGKKVTCKITVK